MIFKIAYIFFFIAAFLYGSVPLAGPITPRHIMTLVMLALCFREGMPKLDKYISTYLIFIVCFCFSGVIYSRDFADTLKWVLAEHFVGLVAYQATKILVNKYNAAHFFIYTYIIIGLLDAVVTIGQFYVGPYAEVIMKMVSNNLDTGQIEAHDYHGGDTMAGFVPPGLVGSVPNGYLLSAMCIMSLYCRKAKIRIIHISMWLLCLFALYCTQEKTALVCGSVLSLYYLYKLGMEMTRNNKYKRLLFNLSICAGVFAIVAVAISLVSSNEEMRYNAGFEMTDERNQLITNAVRFITENPFGGIFEYNRQNHYLPPHNLFLNCFVWGGYLGGLSVLLILIWKGVIVAKTLLAPLGKENNLRFTCCIAYLAFTLNSLTHNSSIVMGDFYFWAFWAICITTYKHEETKEATA